MASRHPSPAAHVAHFMASVEDYENLEGAFPMPTEVDGFSSLADRDRWIVVLHATILRKYFVADERSNERMRLSEVARSLQAIAIGDGATHDWGPVVQNVAVLEPSMEYVHDGRSRSEHDVASDQLYGRYLHGDYDKWQRTGKPSSLQDIPLLIATSHRAVRLMTVAQLVRSLQNDGLLAI